MEKYDEMIQTVFLTLKQFNYKESTINYYQRCYRNLELYLAESGKNYSPEDAEEWYLSIQHSVAAHSLSLFGAALIKLRDVYLYGYVLTEHIRGSVFTSLSKCNSEIIDTYKMKLSSEFTDTICDEYSAMVADFLYFAESLGCASYLQLSYDIIREFFLRKTEKPMYRKQKEDRIIYHFLLWLYELGVCTYGFPITLHYMLTNNGQADWLNVSDVILYEMRQTCADTDVHADVLPSIIEDIVSDLKKQNYSKTSISPYRRVLEQLFLFLDEMDLNYSPDIASLWLYNTGISFQKEGRIERRALKILEDKLNGIEVNYEKFYRFKPTKVETLADWCRPTVIQFLNLKEREGMQYNTVAMYRSSLIRFCRYLNAQGITSFSDIATEHIKAFNLQDSHKTPEGKNAYNTRIRKFLKYLGEEGIIPNLFLYLSVPCESVNREYIVITLSEEEKDQLNDQLKSDNLSLRDKAVLLLGYRLGIRGSDIADLEISSIDWNNSTIRFVQNKTSTELILPLTPDVGNALYRYIMEERPDSELSTIFLRERAPFTSINRSICRRTMKRTFPERDVPGSCFHVLRKTMATELLRSGSPTQTVTDVLGHTNGDTVMKYLSLDEERMRKCAISLETASLEYKGSLNHA